MKSYVFIFCSTSCYLFYLLVSTAGTHALRQALPPVTDDLGWLSRRVERYDQASDGATSFMPLLAVGFDFASAAQVHGYVRTAWIGVPGSEHCKYK
ncbi:hypothetical protein FKP32DRAFT_497851 [Trametes sanguinea]|nr:hypothetical protein FKP32DRAFT_497851 [Trametes sanguinea]